MRERFVAEIVDRSGALHARPLIAAARAPVRLAGDARAGEIVIAEHSRGGARIVERLAPAGSALAKLYHLAAEHGADPVFAPPVEAEVEQLLADPHFDDPELEDLTTLPMVTIDGPGTRDLDQALAIAREPDGYRVDYALADPSWCVRPGTALFDEALARGASYYLPGLSIPMLPRALSEGIISLNPGQPRRAMVFRMHLDRSGGCAATEIVRARIRSRAQLTFEEVERVLAGRADAPSLSGDALASLELFAEVGRLRLKDAERRDVVRYRRTETEVTLGKRRMRFVVIGGTRTAVERYNEQLSLLCNIEGARFLLRSERSAQELMQPIYRVHAAPPPERYAELEQLLAALAARHGLDPEVWCWRRGDGQSLSDMLERLPARGRAGRIARAIHRQAVLINVRSLFSDEAERHHGVGAEVYARFSAPMREIVGVYLHKETFERLAGTGAPPEQDEALRARVVERANEAKALQKRLTKAANLMVLDQLFEGDLERPAERRPRRIGTVMGLTPSKAHVLLDAPAVEVKVYTRHLARQHGQRVTRSEDGTQLELADGRALCRIGDAVEVRLLGRDKRSWHLAIGVPPRGRFSGDGSAVTVQR